MKNQCKTSEEREEKNSVKIKKASIRGRSKFWRSKESPLQLDDTFENLWEFVDFRIKSSNIQKAIEVLKLRGGEKILDFGAANCWASYLFSKIGCDVTALDFSVDDASLGLLAGKRIIESTGIVFKLVAGDCEQMPFKDESFDISFGSQILHHAEDLNEMVSEVARVTRRGGGVIAIDEAKRGLFKKEEVLKKHHKAVPYGANEHYPSYFQYMNAFKKAGLVDVSVFCCINWEALKETINTVNNPFKKCVYKLIFMFLSPFSSNRILIKFIAIFSNCSVIITGKRKRGDGNGKSM